MKRFLFAATALFAIVAIIHFHGCESSTESSPPYPEPPEFGLTHTALVQGPAGSWDNKNVANCSVIADGDTLRMWYSGNSTDDPVYKIGYAWSTDYIHWNRQGDSYVLAKSFDWEGPDFGRPVVIKDGGMFRMWYHGWAEDVPFVVGYAVSNDGINWTKNDQPVLERTAAGFGSYEIGLWSVIKIDNLLNGWYYGTNNDYTSGTGCIGLRTSTDGISWTDNGFCLHQSNVEGHWEKDYAIDPLVVITEVNGNPWQEMLYLGFSRDPLYPDLGYAVKKDNAADSWHKSAKNPIRENSDLTPITESYIWLDALIYDPDTGAYHLYYTAYNERYEIRYCVGMR